MDLYFVVTKASQDDDATLTDKEVVRVNNRLEHYGVSIDSVGTHVKLCLRNNVHAKQLVAALLLEVCNNLLRWHLFLRSEYIPVPTNVVSTLRSQAYKYKDYAGLYFFCATLGTRQKTQSRSSPEPARAARTKKRGGYLLGGGGF